MKSGQASEKKEENAMKNHGNFHSANGKRLIMIVDDELINRELLAMTLQDEYETVTASDGQQALGMIREKSDMLSLILLDLLMPGMHGLDLLKTLKEDPELKHIPVIVLTADQEAEVASLKLGAADFIPKPYPKREVILTRVLRTIELSEDRDIIEFTERDSLTGLYNREYFYRYAQQFDQHHKDLAMDAIVLDVFHFHMINERYGKACGDDVLRRIGEKLRESVRDAGGIVCRREADTFLVYCPHRQDYAAILEHASIGLDGGDMGDSRVRLRMGVYENADKAIEIERRFDRAKLAADTVRNNFVKAVALYDNALHESEIYSEQLLEDFQQAIEQKQFMVYYQPKFSIRGDAPELASAEALVRWQHPRLGMISPGVFVPLFEDNGLIQHLDHYVWREAARQAGEWRRRFGVSVPVSVNVSRVDMYDPGLVDTFRGLLEENGLQAQELLLEITESAYTQDSAQIINTVNQLRALGFRIEMDDFGTGYSSLNMISALPIDALKLDMKFIRDAFRDGRDTRLIEVIIDIADYLDVPVIAEGVETEEQLNALKSMGCDIVQGYYFSKPVPAEKFERFVMEKARRAQAAAPGKAAAVLEHVRHASHSVPIRIAQALAADYFSIYYVDLETDDFVEYSAQQNYRELGIENEGADFFALSRRNIPRVVYTEDQEKILAVFTKENLLRELAKDGTLTLTYRLMIGGQPTYVSMKATQMADQHDPHLVIGINNIDAQMRREQEPGA